MSSKTIISPADGFRVLYNALTEAACTSEEEYDSVVHQLDSELPGDEALRIAAIVTPRVMTRARAVVGAMQDGEVITYGTLGEAVGTKARGAMAIITSVGTAPEDAGIVLHKPDRSGMFVERNDHFFSSYDADGNYSPRELTRSDVLKERNIPFSMSSEMIVIDPKDVRVLGAAEARARLFI